MRCPPDIQRILSKILSTSLLQIRRKSESTQQVVAEADHLHNLPDLLDNFEEAKLLYYWQVERPEYLQSLTIGERTAFEPLWTELEHRIAELGEMVAPLR